MEPGADPRREIWVVDHLDHLRALVVAALRGAGFSIRDYREYADLLVAPYGAAPFLVLLGCVSARVAEQDLLQALERRGWPVVVLSSSLTLTDLRHCFHAGAVDVIERPHTSTELLSVVGPGRWRHAQSSFA